MAVGIAPPEVGPIAPPASRPEAAPPPEKPMHPLDNPKLSKIHPSKQKMIRYMIENSWMAPDYTTENIPLFTGAEEKSKVLNEGEQAVTLKLRSGDQVNPETRQPQLVFGVSPTDADKLIIADDNRIVSHESRSANTGWEYDRNKITAPVVLTMQDGKLFIFHNGEPYYLTPELLGTRGKLIMPLTKEVSLGIADFDLAAHTVTVFKRPTDTTPPGYINNEIEAVYAIEQRQNAATEAEKKRALNRTNYASRLKKWLITLVPIPFLAIPGDTSPPVEQPQQPPIIQEDTRPKPNITLEQTPTLQPIATPEPAEPSPVPVKPREGGPDIPEKKEQEQFLEWEYNEPTSPDKSFEGLVQSWEATIQGVEPSSVGRRGEKYFDLKDPAKNAEVDKARRKFEQMHPELAKAFREVAREQIVEINGQDMLPELSDRLTRPPVKTRSIEHMLQKAAERVAS